MGEEREYLRKSLESGRREAQRKRNIDKDRQTEEGEICSSSTIAVFLSDNEGPGESTS